ALDIWAGAGVEPVRPRLELFLRELAHAAVRISLGLTDLLPVAGGLAPVQGDRQARGRRAAHRVEDVGRDAHTFSSFSSRSRVILRCSAAATRSSVAGSLAMP